MKIKFPQCDFENEEGSKFCKNCNELLSKQDLILLPINLKKLIFLVILQKEKMLFGLVIGNKFLN